jgi:hypothetical protein
MLYAALAIALVLFLVAAVGAMLPVQHTASRSARVALPPEALHRLLKDLKYGDVPVRIERDEPPSLLVTRVAGENLPFGGTWTFRVSPAQGGSELVITEHGEVYNVIFRFVSRFVTGHHATLDGYLRALQQRVNEAQPPAPGAGTA